MRQTALMLVLICATTTTAGAAEARAVPSRLPVPQSFATSVFFKFDDFFGSNTRSSDQKSFLELDRDRDGSLSAEELDYAFGSQSPNMLTRLDKDRDGRVTVDEVRETSEMRNARHAEGDARQKHHSESEAREAARTTRNEDSDSQDAGGEEKGSNSSNASSGNDRSDDRGANGNGNGPR